MILAVSHSVGEKITLRSSRVRLYKSFFTHISRSVSSSSEAEEISVMLSEDWDKLQSQCSTTAGLPATLCRKTLGTGFHLSSGIEQQLLNGMSCLPEKEVFRTPFEHYS